MYTIITIYGCVKQSVMPFFYYLLDKIFIRFGTKLYRQTIGIPMGTNCAPLVADLFIFLAHLSKSAHGELLWSVNVHHLGHLISDTRSPGQIKGKTC